MTNTNRPLSPFMMYRPQITSVLSILHRITGVCLSAGILLLVYWLVAVASGPESYALAHALLWSGLGRIFLMGWTFCFYYHLCNGIRHLAWDAGFGFELAQVSVSGWAVVIASSGLTVLTWVMILGGAS